MPFGSHFIRIWIIAMPILQPLIGQVFSLFDSTIKWVSCFHVRFLRFQMFFTAKFNCFELHDRFLKYGKSWNLVKKSWLVSRYKLDVWKYFTWLTVTTSFVCFNTPILSCKIISTNCNIRDFGSNIDSVFYVLIAVASRRLVRLGAVNKFCNISNSHKMAFKSYFYMNSMRTSNYWL